jgi:hypothetical protein
LRYIIAILTFSLFSCRHTPKQENSWLTLDFKAFKLQTPKGWSIIKARGIDSFIGGLTNGRDTLSFDLGWYSPSVGDEEPSNHKLAIDTVNGLGANIVIPNVDGQGVIAMSISSFKDGQDKFIISGSNIVGTDTILQIFKSIVFEESDTTKNPALTMDKFKWNPTGSDKYLFRENCGSCHSRKELMVGPALSGIKTKRTFEWTYNFLVNRKSLLTDTAFINLTRGKEYHCMEFPKMTKEELQRILNYID